MCGVVATVAARPRNEDRLGTILKSMTTAIRHRGPDAGGVSVLGGGRVGFGHRRLSIVNLGPDGDQPMRDASGRVTVVFNGEIYNHLALRAELEQIGCRFLTAKSDTEVLVQGYLAWGFGGLLARLHGMFAFVLWDEEEDRLLAARDRLGIKPLYYAQVGDELVIASEIKAIAAHPEFTVGMNHMAFLDVLNVLATPCPTTLFDGVFKLAPGEMLAARPGAPPIRSRYWHAPGGPSGWTGSRTELVAEVDARLAEAVRHRLADEVETSILLSGGVDSSLILAQAARAGVRLKAFTAAYVNDPLNELEPAARVAREFGFDHHVVEIDESKAMAGTLALMESMDEPIADWACIPLDYLSKAVGGAGVKVALVGEGADELFCGYESWTGFVHEAAIWRGLALAGRLGAGMAIDTTARLLARSLPLSRFGLKGALDVASAVGRGRGRFRSGAEALRPFQAEALLRPGWRAARPMPDPAGDPLVAELETRLGTQPPSSDLDPSTLFARMRGRDLAFRLPELLLMRVDKVTMASSVEARVPFLDHHFVEFVMGLPPKRLFEGKGSKPLLKDVARRHLPADIVDRPKIGLGAPMAKWLRGKFGLEVEAILEAELSRPDTPFDARALRRLFHWHRAGRRDYAAYLWPVINLALWRSKWLS